jgi:aspartyl-tRNA(Asn)/glutamyl-tRNA(Gln) amidotransferase subunit B
VKLVENGVINLTTGKSVLAEMFESGKSANEIVVSRGLRQISDPDSIAKLVETALQENPNELESYLGGKEGLLNWFFGQIMRATKGKANPQIVHQELSRQLSILKDKTT